VKSFNIYLLFILTIFPLLGCQKSNNSTAQIDNKSYINDFELLQENPNKETSVKITSPKAIIDPTINDIEIYESSIEIMNENGIDFQVESGNATLNNLSNNSDIVLFMAMKRIWESEYVRSRGYNREISYWLTKIDFQQQNEFKNNYTFQKLKKLSFISVAEDLVKGEKSTDEKLEALLLLEALRSACNMMDKKQYNKLVFRFIN